jgi:hypothetical protein
LQVSFVPLFVALHLEKSIKGPFVKYPMEIQIELLGILYYFPQWNDKLVQAVVRTLQSLPWEIKSFFLDLLSARENSFKCPVQKEVHLSVKLSLLLGYSSNALNSMRSTRPKEKIICIEEEEHYIAHFKNAVGLRKAIPFDLKEMIYEVLSSGVPPLVFCSLLGVISTWKQDDYRLVLSELLVEAAQMAKKGIAHTNELISAVNEFFCNRNDRLEIFLRFCSTKDVSVDLVKFIFEENDLDSTSNKLLLQWYLPIL